MDIRPIDPSADEQLRAAYDVMSRAELLGREDSPHWSFPEMAGAYQRPDSGERQDLLGGFVDGRLVGVAATSVPLLDNLDKAWVGVDVDPAEQHKGFGTQLLAAATELMAAAGRTLLVGEMKVPFAERDTHGYRRFCERNGYEFANAEVVRWLSLPVAEETIQGWADLAAERHHGYTIETYVNEVPPELVPSLCVLLGQLGVDAPTGAVDWEEEVISPERFVEARTSLVKAGRTIYETVAVTDDRTVVAQSTMSVPPPGRTAVSQWGTFVHREHRGHRLGLATKAANLRTVQRAHPEMLRVVTQNGETNDYMVAINELMGFEPAEVSVEMFRKL